MPSSLSLTVALTLPEQVGWLGRAAVRGLDPYPLSAQSINVAGAYRSTAQYLAAMKREHVAKEFAWRCFAVGNQGCCKGVR